jgi:hypothetical protein
MTNIVPTLSKMSLEILNFEKTLFPALQEQLGILSPNKGTIKEATFVWYSWHNFLTSIQIRQVLYYIK